MPRSTSANGQRDAPKARREPLSGRCNEVRGRARPASPGCGLNTRRGALSVPKEHAGRRGAGNNTRGPNGASGDLAQLSRIALAERLSKKPRPILVVDDDVIARRIISEPAQLRLQGH